MTEAVVRVTGGLGIDLGTGGAESWVGSAWPDLHAGLEVQARSGLDLMAFLHRIADVAESLVAEGFPVRELPGGAALIQRLVDQGVPVGVVTGSMREEAHAALTDLGVIGALDIVLTAEDYAPGKPHPACYLLAAERLGVHAPGCVVVEDSRVGVASGVAAGMWVIAVTAANAPEGHPAHQRVEAAHVVVDSLLAVTDDHLEPRHAGG